MQEMEEIMRYSFVLPIYNVGRYLERCIRSILEQEIQDYEIILVNDGSKDNSGKICDDFEKMDHRIRVIHKENGGLSDSRNVGIEVAKGDYLLLIDSDDYIDKNLLKEIDKVIENYPDVDIIQFEYYIDYNGKIEGEDQETYIKELRGKEICNSYLKSTGFVHTAWNKVYRKHLFDEIRYPVRRLSEDIATTYKIYDKSNLGILINKKLYYYVVRSNSIMGTGTIQLRRDSFSGFCENYEYFSSKYDYELADVAEWYVKKCLRLFAILSTMTNSSEKIQLMNEIKSEIKKKSKFVRDIKVKFHYVIFRVSPWLYAKCYNKSHSQL